MQVTSLDVRMLAIAIVAVITVWGLCVSVRLVDIATELRKLREALQNTERKPCPICGEHHEQNWKEEHSEAHRTEE